MSILIYGINHFDYFLHSAGIEELSSPENFSREKIDSESSEENENCESSNVAAIKNAQEKLHLDFASGGHAFGWISALKRNLVPGTYQHFLLLLFESPENIHEMQADMQRYLQRHYFNQLKQVYNRSGEESHDCFERETLVPELQILRELLAPVRANAGTNAISRINWIEETDEDVADTQQTLEEAAAVVIAEFESEIQKKVSRGKDRLPLNSSDEDGRSASRSLRFGRLDACKASCSSAFDKTFPAPVETPTTRESVSDQPDFKELVVMAACWLAKARGTATVNLFCDLAKRFASKPSKRILKDGELWNLYKLSTLYPSDSTPQHLGDPWVGYDPEMPNSQYFRDCETSQNLMIESVRAGSASLRSSESTPLQRQGFQFNADSLV